jgi:phosphate transport system substrate-binding protein
MSRHLATRCILPILAMAVAPWAVADAPVEVAGSATFYPLAQEVARRASASPDGGDYHLNPTGTLAGIAALCAGDGPGFPEIVNATRRMREAEVADCKAHGVDAIVEVKIGYDGVALAARDGGHASDAGPDAGLAIRDGGHAGGSRDGRGRAASGTAAGDAGADPGKATSAAAPARGLSLGVRDLYLALAHLVPDPQGGDRLVPNPYRTWHEVNPELSDTPIRVIGSAAATGTRDTLAELGLEAGCAQVEAVRRITGRNRHRMAELCRPLRADGAWRELPGTDADLVQALRADPQAVAVIGWHALASKPGAVPDAPGIPPVLEGNQTGLKTLTVEGVPPSRSAIVTGVYALTRPIYMYFKKTNLESLPAIQRYVAEATSDSAWGDEGYLTAAGMVPMMVDERQKYGYIAEHWVEPACPPFCR